ncbi:ABC transporter ATP-binding protein/permease [Chlamydiales bacterium]|nr:ABC transporter ATP-binding protein/permease [Chlamydiales bacterium]
MIKNQHTLPKSEFKLIMLLFLKIKRSKLLGVVFFLTFGQSLYLFLPALLGFLIDSIFVKDNWNIEWLFLFPIVWSLSNVFVTISRFIISSITQDVRKFSKELVFKYLIRLSNNVYIDKGAGEVENLMQEVSFSSRYIFAESFPFFIRIFVSVIVSILILCYSSFWLGLLFSVWLLLYIPISYIIARGSINHVSRSLVSSADVSSLTVDIIENHELIPAFGTEKFETNKFKHLLEREWKAYIDAQFGIDKADLFQHFIQLLLPFGMVLFIILTRDYLGISPGDIVALFTVTLIITAQIRDFGRSILAFFEIKERLKTALRQLINFQKPNFSIQNFERGTELPKSYEILFNNVGYIYDTNHTALQNITLAIKENEKIGIIGYSGAGKSTLIKLLRGYYIATSGDVYLGGICLNEVNPKFLSENISEVSQTIPLFHRSIRENVAYGCNEVTDDKVWQILERSQLADYVKKLPNGLDTVIGVKGSKFSGGERARLAIARAFLKNSKIIILDEATASLDSDSESLLQKSLEELMSGRTVIAIAHRLSTLRSMDRILVFEKGQIIADDCHYNLLQANGHYKKLWNMQVLV